MFGSVWQARGQQHNELLHPQVLEFVVDFEPRRGWRGYNGDAIEGVYFKY
jgi:hypothetical protein